MKPSFHLFVHSRLSPGQVLFKYSSHTCDNEILYLNFIRQWYLEEIVDLVEKIRTPQQNTDQRSVSSYHPNIVNTKFCSISVLVVQTDVFFVLLHQPLIANSSDSVKQFLREIYELYGKLVLNPFFDRYNPWPDCFSGQFSRKLQSISIKYMR